jgi:hypothetical protein
MASTSNLSLMDQLVNDEGLKFTVTLTITPDTYMKIFLTIFGAVVVSGFSLMLLQNVIKK